MVQTGSNRRGRGGGNLFVFLENRCWYYDVRGLFWKLSCCVCPSSLQFQSRTAQKQELGKYGNSQPAQDVYMLMSAEKATTLGRRVFGEFFTIPPVAEGMCLYVFYQELKDVKKAPREKVELGLTKIPDLTQTIIFRTKFLSCEDAVKEAERSAKNDDTID